MYQDTASINSIEKEFDGIPFSDKRHSKRLKTMATEFWNAIGSNIPNALSNGADIKAAYRFFSNENVEDSLIQHGHFLNTVQRIEQEKDPKLVVVQDTSTLSFESHPRTTGLGSIGNVSGKRHIQGIHFHTSLVFNTKGVPLGLLEQEVWPRKLRRSKKNLHKIPVELKESGRWSRSIEIASHVQEKTGKRLVVVSDREGDLNHQIVEAIERGVGFIIRAREDRLCLAGDEPVSLKKFLKAQGDTAFSTIEMTSRKKHYLNKNPRKSTKAPHIREPEEKREIKLSIHWSKVTLSLKKEDGTKLQQQMGAVWAYEVNSPGRPKHAPISWLLLSNDPIESFEDAKQIMAHYKQRWEIEVYHRILKSGCNVEDCRLSEGERLTRYLLVMGVIAWRIHFLTNYSRSNIEALAEEVFDSFEILALQLKLKLDRKKTMKLSEAIRHIAILGGFMGRKSDKNPGATTIWRGLQKLTFLAEGLELAKGA